MNALEFHFFAYYERSINENIKPCTLPPQLCIWLHFWRHLNRCITQTPTLFHTHKHQSHPKSVPSLSLAFWPEFGVLSVLVLVRLCVAMNRSYNSTAFIIQHKSWMNLSSSIYSKQSSKMKTHQKDTMFTAVVGYVAQDVEEIAANLNLKNFNLSVCVCRFRTLFCVNMSESKVWSQISIERVSEHLLSGFFAHNLIVFRFPFVPKSVKFIFFWGEMNFIFRCVLFFIGYFSRFFPFLACFSLFCIFFFLFLYFSFYFVYFSSLKKKKSSAFVRTFCVIFLLSGFRFNRTTHQATKHAYFSTNKSKSECKSKCRTTRIVRLFTI